MIAARTKAFHAKAQRKERTSTLRVFAPWRLGVSCFDFFTPSERRGVGELTPFLGKEGAGVTGLSLQEIANG
jgi:hypothetical protein